MNQLPIFVNLQGRKVILLGEGPAADAKRRLYERAGAEIVNDEDADAALAVVAIEEEGEALAAIDRLRSRGLLVNAVDRSQHCDFTTPAIVDRDPVLVAIGTGGKSAGLAKALRQRIEQILPVSIGDLAVGLLNARDKMKEIWPASAARRKAIDHALGPGNRLDPFSARSADHIADWLDKPEQFEQQHVIDLELRSTDPDDLTIKQARLLSQADQIYADSSVPSEILNRARADAERFSLADFENGDVTGLTLLLRMAD